MEKTEGRVYVPLCHTLMMLSMCLHIFYHNILAQEAAAYLRADPLADRLYD